MTDHLYLSQSKSAKHVARVGRSYYVHCATGWTVIDSGNILSSPFYQSQPERVFVQSRVSEIIFPSTFACIKKILPESSWFMIVLLRSAAESSWQAAGHCSPEERERVKSWPNVVNINHPRTRQKRGGSGWIRSKSQFVGRWDLKLNLFCRKLTCRIEYKVYS